MRIAISAVLVALAVSPADASPPRRPPPLDSEREIRALIESLASGNIRTRQAAARRLLREGIAEKEALAALARDLRHERLEVRLDAVTALPAGRDPDVDRLAVTVLIEALRHEDPKARRRAVSLLPHHGTSDDRALPALRGALGDPIPAVRLAAVEAITRADPTGAAASVLPLLRDADAGVRNQVADSLGDLRARSAVRALIEARTDADPAVRCAMAVSLGQIGGEGVIPVLVEMLRREKSPEVRAEAMWGLGHRASEGDPLPVAVVAALGDPAHRVRFLAAKALRETKDPALIAGLAAALAIEKGPAPLLAAKILDRIGEDARAAVPALLAALDSERMPLARAATEALGSVGGPEAGRGLARALRRDPTRELAGHICDGLEEVGGHGRDAVPVLLGMLDGPHRLQALGALGGVGGDEARRALLATLRDSKEPDVRRYALYGLRDMAPRQPEAVDALIGVLRGDPDHENRDRAASAMRKIGGDTATDALIEALGDPHPHVRDHVLNHLRNLDAEDRIPLETLTILAVDDYHRVSRAATSLLAARDGEAADWAIFGVFVRRRSIEALRAVPTTGEIARAARGAVTESAREQRDPEVRIGALGWLVAHDPAAARPLLLEALATAPVDGPAWRRTWPVRAKAAEMLGDLEGEDPAVIAALEGALEDDSRSVRRAASGALAKIRAR